MKEYNKSSIFTGVVLLSLAALFSISLILVPLDFGIAGPGHNNFFFKVGSVLFSVYGYSSIFIPVFLLLSGISCFATKWTARKTMRLITALIPFFTCVLTENICRSILKVGHSEFVGIKLAVIIITGAMLVVVEFFGAGFIADLINKKSKSKKEESSTVGFTKIDKFKLPEDFKEDVHDEHVEKTETSEVNQTEQKDETETPESESDEENIDEIMAKGAIFDDVLSEIVPTEEFSLDEDIQELEEEPLELEEIVEEPEEKPASEENEDIQDSTSIITQEEFDALTNPTPLTDPEMPADELEWNNLPPASEILPPEYDSEFDENDPSLEFPPKEKDEKVEDDDAEDEDSDDFDFEELTSDFDEIEKSSLEDLSSDYEAFSDLEEDNEEPEKDDEEDFETTLNEFNIDFDHLGEDDESDNEPEAELEEVEEAPVKHMRFNDRVVDNPKYPRGITIRDDSENDLAEMKTPADIEITTEHDDEEDDFEDDYEEDVTLPFPDFGDEEPDAEDIIKNQKSVIDDDFEDVATIDFDDDDEIEIEKTPAEEEQPDIFNQIANQEQKENIYTGRTSANVFSDMEEDIRKAQEKKIAKEKEENFDTSIGAAPLSVNNLTADELSDFFNAQQEENTPKTQEIPANPPKVGNRAVKKGPYVIPSDLLTAYKDDQYWIIDEATKQSARNLKQTLAEFNIEAEITGIKKGPVVTMFEILPAPGVRLSKIVALQDNIALSLAAQSVRIVAPIPGKQAVGIEVPNKHRSVVGFREIIEMNLPEWKKMAVPVILGKDILGKAQLIDLVKTPHMLIAGATGSGKSVCVNSLILSILYKRSYKDVKLMLIDPKVVELKLYNDIPHLLTPVITEPKKALKALQYCLCEMERRYALLDSMGVRDIANYNQKIKEQKICTEKLPYIVVIIDEFADLMATSGKELESIVARLTAMSRAVGIHLVLATQRPSVNVITGLIKANIPTRIAFMVASRTDSNIIIDQNGAEKLLGRGDMLYASAVDPAPIRIQGTFVSDQEVEDVVAAVKEYGEPDYLDESIFEDDEDERGTDLFGEPVDDDDPLYDQALEIVVQAGKASASYIQRRLKIGYNRAARIVEEMEERGIVGPANGSKPREIIHIP